MLHEIEPYKLHIEYKDLTPEGGDLCLLYDGPNVLAAEADEVILPTVGEVRKAYALPEDVKFRYLFAVDEIRFFALPGTKAVPFGRYILQTMRWLRITGPQHLAYAAGLGNQISIWYTKNVFCGRCGARTVHAEKERMMRCPDCGNMIYPQICPSVIIGILNGDKLLVTKYNPKHLMIGNGTTHAPTVTYALVAGYVESGETPEETVRREVMEEVGLKVKNIRYFKSQPWPFSGALLFGYFCDLDGDDKVTLEEDELSVAEWKTRDQMEDRSKDVSLTSLIMETFRRGEI